MFFLGILSLFQIAILPGIILFKLLKIKTDILIQKALYVFGFSLFFNYLLICFLAWQKLYTPQNIYILFFIELLLLGYWVIKKRIGFPNIKNLNDYNLQFTNFLKKLTFIHKFAFTLSCLTILFFTAFLPVNAASILSVLDAVARDKWVIDWASNNLPLYTGHYPQLLISNLSLPYVFMQGNAIQFFPKAIMPLFFIGILLIFLDLYLQKKSIVYLTGLILYGIIVFVFYSLTFSGDCNLDIPVSFFGFLTFYNIIRRGNTKFNMQGVLLTALFASIAADTKLAGMYIVTFSVLWVGYVIYKNKENISKYQLIKTSVFILFIFFGNLFWYLIMPAEMYRGLNEWISMLSPNYWERFLNSANMLLYSFGNLLSIFLLATLIFSLFVKQVKYLTLVMVVVPVFLWMFFYSYDYRNLSISIPFMALSSSYGFKYFYENNAWMQRIVHNINSNKYFNSYYFQNKNFFLRSLFIFFIVGFLLIASTNIFFNFGMSLSYFLNKIYYMYYRTIYTTEFGYYIEVKQVIDTLKVMGIILILMFFLRKTKIRLSYFLILFLGAAIILNFTLFTKENLIQRQNNDIKMVDARNLHYRLYSYIENTGIGGTVITNYEPVCKLIPPEDIQFKHISINISSLPLNKQESGGGLYLLLENKKLNKETNDYIKNKIKDKDYILQFDDGEFVFLKIVS